MEIKYEFQFYFFIVFSSTKTKTFKGFESNKKRTKLIVYKKIILNFAKKFCDFVLNIF